MSQLPLTATQSPLNAEELAAVVRAAHHEGTPVYPLGGETSLNFGVPAKAAGIGLSLSGMRRIIDYPARDMTITVEAGISLRTLAETLAEQRQQLPVDVPQADRATLGGVIATNWNGPRRYGYGPLRDFVIGVQAVDGRGALFHGGGRVVKNVAGYDFCKLLTGSMGTLGVITQVTLKVRPIAEQVRLELVPLNTNQAANAWLEAMSRFDYNPSALELVSGVSWNRCFAAENATPSEYYGLVRWEGSGIELDWLERRHGSVCQSMGLSVHRVKSLETLWAPLVEWSAEEISPLVLQARLPASGVMPFIATVREEDARSEFQAHAGNGIVNVRLSEFPAAGLSRLLMGKLQPRAAELGGQLVVLSNPSGTEITRQCVWGGNDGSLSLQQAVKHQFDPAGILNPGRFL